MAKGKKSTSIPVADVHTPDELLSGAELLLRTGEPGAMRAVVLEAVTALEVFVHKTVFGILPTKLDPLLVKWLEDKTKMDFDSRLSVLAPVATDQSIDKESALWDAYKKARDIRHKVVHAGRKVTRVEAEFVVKTIYDWLGFLGSHLDVDLSLLALKKHVEGNRVEVKTLREATKVVGTYYQSTMAARVGSEVLGRVDEHRFMADLMLKFGENRVVVETKMVTGATSLDYSRTLPVGWLFPAGTGITGPPPQNGQKSRFARARAKSVHLMNNSG